MTETLTLAIKYFPNSVSKLISGRVYLQLDEELILPKRLWWGAVKLYPNDLQVDSAKIAVFDEFGELRVIVPISKIKNVKDSGVIVVDGIKFKYVDKICRRGDKYQVTIEIPLEIKKILDKILRSGFFETEDAVIIAALKDFYRRKRWWFR